MTSSAQRTQHRFADGRRLVVDETARLLDCVADDQWDRAGELITSSRSIFVIGSGRSGLAASMAAMRLMHLGLRVHVVGEVTAPAIAAGDLLIAVSGSGASATALAAVDTAHAVGAAAIAVTTSPTTPLAQRSDHVLLLAAADKQDHSGLITQQYSGSLFEQVVMLAFDALFFALWHQGDQSVERLWGRHANLS